MALELDHIFICTAPAAPEADKLVDFGLREGPPNQHEGQGTANRRFPFLNAMLEFLWVSDPAAAQSENTRRTLLWERWRDREGQASPFGICLRPSGAMTPDQPFPGWSYRPAYLPDPLVIHIGDAGTAEPMWVYLDFLRRLDHQQRFVEHPVGIQEMTAVTLTTPVPLRSEAARNIVAAGILATTEGEESLLEIEFDANRRKQIKDFRPDLPLVFHF
jgi:hypothetical protein